MKQSTNNTMGWKEVIQQAGLSQSIPPEQSIDLQFHHLSLRDSLALTRAMQTNQEHLESFLPLFHKTEGKTVPKIQRWIFGLLEEGFPSQHFVFTIDGKICGFASTLPVSKDPQEVQLRYMVFEGFTGRGIATRIAYTLEFMAFHVWGFQKVFIEMDSSNRASMKVAQKLGYQLIGTKDVSKVGTKESGFWYSFAKQRPDDIADGVLQGKPMEDFG